MISLYGLCAKKSIAIAAFNKLHLYMRDFSIKKKLPSGSPSSCIRLQFRKSKWRVNEAAMPSSLFESVISSAISLSSGQALPIATP